MDDNAASAGHDPAGILESRSDLVPLEPGRICARYQLYGHAGLAGDVLCYPGVLPARGDTGALPNHHSPEPAGLDRRELSPHHPVGPDSALERACDLVGGDGWCDGAGLRMVYED